MARTKQQQLDALDAVIAQIEASPNASVTILGRTFTKHQLSELYAERKTLEALAKREARGGALDVKRVYHI